MAEQNIQRRLIYGVFGTGSYTQTSELQSNESPEYIYRGDTLPAAPVAWARWWVATGSAGAGHGEWYYYDPVRAAWLSVRTLELRFNFRDVSSGTIGIASVDPRPMQTVYGAACSNRHGYGIRALEAIVGASKHILTLTRIQATMIADAAPSAANIGVVLALDANWASALAGGGVSMSSGLGGYMSAEAAAKNVEVDASAGNLITAALTTSSGTTTYGANASFECAAFFQRKVEA